MHLLPSRLAANTTLNAIQFGVLLLKSYQFQDLVGPVDYLNTHTHSFLDGIAPPAIVAKAPNITWHYISEYNDFSPITASSGPPQIPTTTFNQTPTLDYLLIPGADIYHTFPVEATKFIQARFPELKGLLTVCVGSLHLSRTGLLDGKRAATNKVALRLTVEQGQFQQFSNVTWVKDERFVRDGKIWSSSGVTAGIDLAAEFARVNFDPDVNQAASEAFEYKANPAQPDAFAYILDGVDLN
ncbi:ThiJ/PfpI [Ephemerocybe angulata]|uniref:ThiJ/PfpI n=1 Tax=Ephemerocybe angulata TaxID=980116 RepID=A0A8H6LVZ3_9AGAR|nr:ThiJ/PfpI [Tulosesus angulatus]